MLFVFDMIKLDRAYFSVLRIFFCVTVISFVFVLVSGLFCVGFDFGVSVVFWGFPCILRVICWGLGVSVRVLVFYDCCVVAKLLG